MLYQAELSVDVPRYKASGALAGYPEPPGSNKTRISVICFPFIDIYRAAGLERLDVLYLDVQGPELDILRTIPFNLVDIKVFVRTSSLLNHQIAHRVIHGIRGQPFSL
jgi:hypothetical protein